jgi:ribulose kinase
MATAVAAVWVSVLALPPLAAAASPPTAIRAVYGTVLTAEYFGPASAVCGNLTAAGMRAFTAAEPGQSCTAAYDRLHHTLHHKQPDNDNSGYTAKAYRSTVATFMAKLKISVHGMRASVHGPSGLGPSKLVEVGGHWRFSAYPPTVES